MAISRVKTWSSGEVLTASDLNAEFNNVLNNGADLVSPFTKAISMGGFALNFDAANTIALTGATNGVSLTGGAFNTPQGADIVASATLNLDTATGNVVDVTGNTGITAVTLSAGRSRWVRFTGTPIITNGASLVLTGGANITAAAGDYALFIGYAAGVVRCTYFPVSGNSVLGISKSIGTTKGDLISFSASATPVRHGVGSDGQAVHADSSQTDGLVYLDNPSRPNLLVNPNWQIDQINEGTLYTVNTTDVRGPDGWSGSAVGAGVFKLRTLADPDNAARKCLEISCTTADASIAATDDYFIYSAIEGYDASEFYFGTSGAKTLTVQFKFKTNVTGVYGVSLANSAKNRSNYQIITVADTSEHEYSLSFTADTTGTWLYTNGVGLYLAICLSAGSNFQGTAGAWAADAKQTTSAQCNFMSANTNIAYLKPIQAIPGALVQAYRAADIQKELAKAQRQYAKTFAQGVAPVQGVGNVNGALTGTCIAASSIPPAAAWRFPVEMRAAPTVVSYSPFSANANWANRLNTFAETTIVATAAPSGVDIYASTAANSEVFYIHAAASSRLS